MGSSLQDTALLLCSDIVQIYTDPSKYRAKTPYSDTLKRLSQYTYHEHKILYDGMAKEYKPGTFMVIAKEMFSDGIVHWGRVVVLYTMCGLIAREREDEEVLLSMGNFFKRHLMSWVSKAGGFESLLSFGTTYFWSQRKPIEFRHYLFRAALDFVCRAR